MTSLIFQARNIKMGLGAFPHAQFSQLGVMYSGKLVAEELQAKYKLNVVKVLFRADAHPWTYNTVFGGYKPDVLHLTFDVKTKEMVDNDEHLTVHAVIKQDSTGEIENMFNIGSTIPKFKKGSTTDLAIEKDSYLDPRKGKHVNNWDPANLLTYPEPPELKHVVLGKGFITVVQDALKTIPKDKQELAMHEAAVEETNIRKALAVIPKDE